MLLIQLLLLLMFLASTVKCKDINLHVCKPHSITVQCASWKVIQIIDAVYGRSDDLVKCGTNNTTLHARYCASRSKLESLKFLCNNKIDCRISVLPSYFGEPCTQVGGEYLALKFMCVSKNGMKASSKNPNVVLLPTPDSFARGASNIAERQYLTHMKVNHSSPVLLPLSYSIGSITKLTSISLDDTKVQNDSLTDLSMNKITRLRVGDGTCLKSTSGERDLAQRFCIYSRAGYVFVTNKGVAISKTSIDRYRLSIYAKDHSTNSTASSESLVINVVRDCYPLSYYYSAMKKNCPSGDIQRFISNHTEWPDITYEIPINDAIQLGRLYIDTNYTSLFFQGNYTVFIQTKERNYSQPFEYYKDYSRIQGKRSSFFPRVYGRLFPILFAKNVFIEKAKILTISIISEAREKNIEFYGRGAAMLFGLTKLKTCPSRTCLKYFDRWRFGYEHMVKSGTLKCIDDDEGYFTHISSCPAKLVIKQEKTYFRREFTLICSGANYEQTKLITWYKNNNILTGVTGLKLTMSGLEFNQQGYYYCQSIGFREGVVESNVILVKYEDVVETKVYFEILKQNYVVMTTKDGEFNIDVKLKSKVKDLLLRGPTMFVSVSMPTYTERVNGWLEVQFIANSQLKANKTSHDLYNDIALVDNLQSIFNPFKIRKNSYIVYDRDVCLSETTGQLSSYGIYKWNYTSSGATGVLLCNHGNGNTTRRCIGNFTGFATWIDVQMNGCEYSSATTAELESILMNSTTSPSEKVIVEIITNTKELIVNQSETLTTDDTIILKDILVNIVNMSDKISVEVAQGLIDVTNNILNIDSKALIASQVDDNALKDIINTVELAAAKLKINSTSLSNIPPQVASKSVAIASVPNINQDYSGGILTVNTALTTNPFRYENSVKEESMADASTARMLLPSTLFKDASISASSNESVKYESVNFVYYNNSRLFPVIQKTLSGNRINERKKVVSGVFAVYLNGRQSVRLFKDLFYQMKIKKEEKENHFYCVYWDFDANDKLGDWSMNGCKKVESSSNTIKCSCNHLTNFAILFDPDGASNRKLDEKHILALNLITYVGCALSLTGIILTMITLLLFRFLRRNTPSKVLLGLCASLGVLMIIFLLLAERTKPRSLCIMTAALLQYFVLTTFAWMLIEALTLYLKVVKVMGEYPTHFMWKASAAALGIPAIIVGVCILLRQNEYGSTDNCIVRGRVLHYGLLLPTCLIILINGIVFVKVVISLRKSSNSSQRYSQSPDVSTQLRIAASCCTLLGLTWLFGVLAIADARLTFQYLFCIFNSLQGAFIFYFNVIRQPRVQEAWKRYISGHGRTYEPSTSSTTSSRLKTVKRNETPTPPLPLSFIPKDYGEDNEGIDVRSELSFTSYVERNKMK